MQLKLLLGVLNQALVFLVALCKSLEICDTEHYVCYEIK